MRCTKPKEQNDPKNPQQHPPGTSTHFHLLFQQSQVLLDHDRIPWGTSLLAIGREAASSWRRSIRDSTIR